MKNSNHVLPHSGSRILVTTKPGGRLNVRIDYTLKPFSRSITRQAQRWRTEPRTKLALYPSFLRPVPAQEFNDFLISFIFGQEQRRPIVIILRIDIGTVHKK